jgi:hypothetical protein
LMKLRRFVFIVAGSLKRNEVEAPGKSGKPPTARQLIYESSVRRQPAAFANS